MMSSTLLSSTATSALSRLFSRHEMMPLQSDVLWQIERGAVRTLTWNSEGIAITLGYWGAGDVVGQSLSQVKPYYIQCLTSVEVRLLPQALWLEALEPLMSHIQQAEELLRIMHLNPLQQRLWQFLGFLGQKFGRDVEQGRLIDLHLTHQEIAEAINGTRITVTRLLQQLESEGVLSRHSKRLILTRR